MARFLAIYHGAADASDKAALTDEQQSLFLDAWASWAQAHREALVDPGAPLYRKKRVTSDGADDFVDSKTGYAIVEAGSHDAAVAIFAEHPHLRLASGNSIEVLECPAPPGQD